MPSLIHGRALIIGATALFSAQVVTAAPRSVQSLDPLVSLSLFGTAQSRSAVCAAGAAAAAAGAATLAGSASATQGVAPGCVLPITTPAPPPPVVGQTVIPQASSGGFSIGTLPLLLGLAAIAALAAVLLLDDDDDDPVSPF